MCLWNSADGPTGPRNGLRREAKLEQHVSMSYDVSDPCTGYQIPKPFNDIGLDAMGHAEGSYEQENTLNNQSSLITTYVREREEGL